jgi:methionyl aminopeptidase
MAITLKSAREIELMRRAGEVVADVLERLSELIEPGMSTARLDEESLRITAEVGADPLFKGVRSPYAAKPFPGAICASINEQIVHGIPSKKVLLSQGDIISIDFGVKLQGYCGDSAVTLPVDKISPARQKLIDVTRSVLDIAIEKMAPGVKWSEVARQMQQQAEARGFSVVTEFAGHGIGREMHEEPRVPNFVSRELLKNDIILRPGMGLAVEPMINEGTAVTRTLRDGWTVVTRDGRSSAHFEHTIAVTDSGCEVLTIKR